MSVDPTWAVQVALVDALQIALGTVPVLDNVPQGQVYPYVTISDTTTAPEDDKTDDGMGLVFTLQAWQRAEATGDIRGSFTPKDLIGKCYGALHRQALQVDGQAVYVVRFEGANYFRDADERTTRGVARFRVLTHTTN